MNSHVCECMKLIFCTMELTYCARIPIDRRRYLKVGLVKLISPFPFWPRSTRRQHAVKWPPFKMELLPPEDSDGYIVYARKHQTGFMHEKV